MAWHRYGSRTSDFVARKAADSDAVEVVAGATLRPIARGTMSTIPLSLVRVLVDGQLTEVVELVTDAAGEFDFYVEDVTSIHLGVTADGEVDEKVYRDLFSTDAVEIALAGLSSGWDIVLAAGDVLAAGTGQVDAALDPVEPRVHYIPSWGAYTGQVVPAAEPLATLVNPVTVGVGPWTSFGRWHTGTSNRRVLLVPVAHPASSIGTGGGSWSWAADGSATAQLIAQGQAALTAGGVGSRVVAFLWAGGTTDAVIGTSGSAMASGLDALIGAVRAAFGASLPVVVSGLPPEFLPVGTGEAVNTAIVTTPARVATSAAIGGLAGHLLPDARGIAAAGQREVGRLMQDALTRLGSGLDLPTIPGEPGVPGTPVVTAQTTTSATVTVAAVTGATAYVVVAAGTVLGWSTSPAVTVTGLTPDTAYTVSVVAVNAGGASAASATATLTTTAVAGPVEDPDLIGDIAASDLVGAYALRAVKAAWADATPVIEVRRSDDGTTEDIGLVDGQLDEAALLAFVGQQATGTVATWYDQSGGSADLTQATASLQPVIVENGAVLKVAGRPAVRFSGSQWLGLTGAGGLGIVAGTGSTAAVVLKGAPQTAVARVWSESDADGTPELGLGAAASSPLATPVVGSVVFTASSVNVLDRDVTRVITSEGGEVGETATELVNHDFTADTDGASWGTDFALGRESAAPSTGGTALIASGKGILRTGLGGTIGQARVSRRVTFTDYAAFADGRIRARWTHNANVFVRVCARADANVDTATGYEISIDHGNNRWRVQRVSGYAGGAVTGTDWVTFTPSGLVEAVLEAVDSGGVTTVRAKLWNVSEGEPSAWVEGTDAAPLAAGAWGVTASPTSTAAQHDVPFESVAVHEVAYGAGSAAQLRMWVDGAAEPAQTFTNPTLADIDTFTLGAGRSSAGTRGFTGLIGEALFWGAELADLDRQVVDFDQSQRFPLSADVPLPEAPHYNADGVRLSAPVLAVASGGFTITTQAMVNKPVNFRYLQLAVRAPNGSDMDLGHTPNLTLDTGQSKTWTSLLRTATTAGTYRVWVAYSLNGTTWVNGPESQITLSAVPEGPPPPPLGAIHPMTDGGDNTGSPTALIYFSGSQTVAAANARAVQIGIPSGKLDGLLTFSGRSSWDEMMKPPYDNAALRASNYLVVHGFGLALGAGSGQIGYASHTDLKRTAEGGNDQWFRLLGERLATAGWAGSDGNRLILRPGWECNGNWYAWSAYDGPVFNAAFSRAVSILRQYGPWAVDLCRNKGPQPGVQQFAYPWSDVDIVGIDHYDSYPKQTDDAGPTFTIAETSVSSTSRWITGVNAPELRSIPTEHPSHWLSLDETGPASVVRSGGGDNASWADQWLHQVLVLHARYSHATIYDHAGAPEDYAHAWSQNPLYAARARTVIRSACGIA